MKILLGRDDVNPGMPDCDDRKPLSHAAEEGHVEMVEILLGRGDVSPDRSDNTDGAPLSYAAGEGMMEWRKYYSDEKRSTPTSRK